MASVADKLTEGAAPVRTRAFPWATVVWFAALIIAANYPILKWLVLQWFYDEDVGHGFFVPVVSAYIVWQRREQLRALSLNPAWWGAVLIAWGAAQGYLGTLAAENFLQRTSVLIVLLGVLIVAGGTVLVRALAFPLALLLFMIPIPGVIYNQITFPLQLFASSVAEASLSLLGIPVIRDGNILELASQKLDVADACSGIRSLLSLTFLSVVYSYFFDKRVWMRWVLLACTVPIAILANSMRVTITGILSEINTDLARGFFHSVEGWVVFLIAGAILIATHRIISRIARLWAREPRHA